MAERAEDLAADGLDIDGNAWDSEPVDATDPKSPRRRRSAQKLEEKSPGGAADEMSSGLRNVQLNHVVGFETDYLALRRLPVRRADLALIIADSVKPPGQAMISDPIPSPSPSPSPSPNPSPSPSPNPNPNISQVLHIEGDVASVSFTLSLTELTGGHVAIFTEHDPVEFEVDNGHYLTSNVGTVPATKVDVEPAFKVGAADQP